MKTSRKLTTNKLNSLPRNDVELEMDTLCCIVWKEDNYSKIMLLEEGDFYAQKTRELFTALKESYKKDKVLNPSTLPVDFKNNQTFLELINKRDATIPSQVKYNIKKLKDIRASREMQSLSYQVAVKTEEGQNSAEIKEWWGKEMEKVNNPYDKKEITVTELEDSFEEMINTEFKSITSGFPVLDSKIGGFEDGTMTIIAAAQGVGKSTMAINLLHHFCEGLNKRVLYVSLEMTFRNLYMLSISKASGVPYFNMKYRKDKITEKQWTNLRNAQARVSSFDQIRMGEVFTTTEDIRYKIKETMPDIVIIDYLQRIKPINKFTNDYEKLTNISNELATLKNELNIPLIVIASVNRKYAERDGKMPLVSDIRGSGAIEFDADTILLLHRDSVFEQYDKETHGSVDKYKYGCKLYIAKQRFGETNKEIDMYFDGTIVLMEEWGQHERENTTRPDKIRADTGA